MKKVIDWVLRVFSGNQPICTHCRRKAPDDIPYIYDVRVKCTDGIKQINACKQCLGKVLVEIELERNAEEQKDGRQD